MGLGKYPLAQVLYYLGTGPKAFIGVVECLGKGPGIVINFVHSSLLQ